MFRFSIFGPFFAGLTGHLQLQRADDLGLPPRTVIVRRDYFSPEEKELYTSLFSDAKRQFNTYLDHGTILNSRYSLLPCIWCSHLVQIIRIFSACKRAPVFWIN